MTTIYLSERTRANDGQYQTFGTYEGPDDRYVFGVANHATLEAAEKAARRMMEKHNADHFARIRD